jgi:chitinase
MTDSTTATATYAIIIPEPHTQVSTPTFSIPAGAYSSAQNVAISCTTSGATIRYTIDGSEPSSSSTTYVNPISVSVTTTIKAKAFVSGLIDSNSISVAYIINLPKVSTPTLSPAGGFYSSLQSVAIQCSTSGAIIHYTISGAEPSSTSPIYVGPISMSATTTIKAKAIMSGMADSDTASATYTIITVARTQALSFEYGIVYAAITTFAIFVLASVLVLYLKSRKKPPWQNPL